MNLTGFKKAPVRIPRAGFRNTSNLENRLYAQTVRRNILAERSDQRGRQGLDDSLPGGGGGARMLENSNRGSWGGGWGGVRPGEGRGGWRRR